MRIHSNATTNLKQRQFIHSSSASCRRLADKYSVSASTVSKWKRRDSINDKSCRPNKIGYAFDATEEKFILFLRTSDLALDDIFDTVSALLPQATRSSIHRLLVRNGVNKRKEQPASKPGVFKDYEPGYLHIDCFYLPRIDGKKRYCYVAVDRATRLVYLRVYKHKNKAAAVDFLGRCLSFYPFMIRIILTDNGREFSNDTFKNRWGTRTKNPHPFGEVCDAVGARHRKTKPYTPKTNGLVERVNGLIQEGTVKRHKYADAQQMIDDLEIWFVYYNFYRRHRQIGHKTPYQKVCQWYQDKPMLFIKEPSSLLAYCT